MIGKWGSAAGRVVRTHSAAPVTYGLIGLCCLLFLLSPASGLQYGYADANELMAAQRLHFRRWGVVPVKLLSGDPGALPGLVTALFVHGSWLHLLGNMLFLYVFGPMAEERMGRLGFAVFYVSCGALALLGYAVANADSAQTLVGASGAISAVLGAFLYLFPRARVTSLLPFLFFLPLRFPAWVTLPFWAALQWVAAGQQTKGPGVAYLAHVVGFTLGFACAWVRRTPPTRVTSPESAPEGENQP